MEFGREGTGWGRVLGGGDLCYVVSVGRLGVLMQMDVGLGSQLILDIVRQLREGSLVSSAGCSFDLLCARLDFHSFAIV